METRIKLLLDWPLGTSTEQIFKSHAGTLFKFQGGNHTESLILMIIRDKKMEKEKVLPSPNSISSLPNTKDGKDPGRLHGAKLTPMVPDKEC